MSVINQMLRDLDKREPNQTTTTSSQAMITSGQGSLYRYWPALLLVVALVLGALWLLLSPYSLRPAVEPGGVVKSVSELNPAQPAEPLIVVDPLLLAESEALLPHTEPLPILSDEEHSANFQGSDADILLVQDDVSTSGRATNPESHATVTTPVKNEEAAADARPQPSMRVDRIELTPQQQLEQLKQQAYEAEQRGQAEQASQLWQQLMALEPAMEEPYLAMAQAAQIRANEAGVQYWLQLALEQGADTISVHEQLAASYARQQLWPQALHYLAYIPETAMSVDHQALQATAWQQLGQHQQALLSFERLAQQQPLQARWSLGMALSHDALGHSDQALDLFGRSLQLGGNLNPATVSYIQQRIQDLN
ncbi:hypothetical protein Q3O60_16405 [Alkalimonas collagenimarina]|uniref:Tetratricopeptide repeat protein n=1 Tax=Alkalimonas collagenimarina TaxID=400390 RepID=A0ABT9H363_9GAMM|nr:hypothetical protein [Alkalimonas collagenimarina]MDP4537766.1 hypothetical protein [Alkalimonas collagenimarina]